MDPVADMLVIIKNGYLARKVEVSAIYSKFKFQIAKVLEAQNFVGKVDHVDNKITIQLRYLDSRPVLSQIKRVSKLGLRIYIKSQKIHPLKGGKGIFIISTPKGVMTGKDAKAKNLGGEVICQVW